MSVPYAFTSITTTTGAQLDADFAACVQTNVLSQPSASAGVGFQQSGAGTVATDLQTRGRLVYYAKDFGAIGDNSTDNYPLFVNALNVIGAHGGGVLYVTGGSNNQYLFKTQAGVSPSLAIPSNVAIVADIDVYYLVQGGAASSGVHSYGTALFCNSNISTGNKNISIIGGKFKSTTATNCGGFIAMKNVINLVVRDVQLLDIVACCRFQASYCLNVKINNMTVDYETPHATPWSYEDGIRIGSGCTAVFIDDCWINSGDDCIAINNEVSETQDSITPQTGIPAYNALGASIVGVTINNVRVANQAGNALRIYQGPTITTGTIRGIIVKGLTGASKQPTTVWSTAISIFDNSGITTNAILEVTIDGVHLDCSGLGTSGGGTPAAVSVQTNGGNIRLKNMVIGSVSVSYGIACGAYTTIENCSISGCVSDSIYTSNIGCVIHANTTTGSGGAGIHIDNGASHTRVIGNKVISSTGGAIVETGGATYTLAMGNDVQGATACVIANNSTSVYEKNPGYNPVGTFSITVTGSPFTYTSATSTETVIMNGGAMSSITVNGVSYGAVTSGVVMTVPPHTPIVVSYTVLPTMTKVVH
jgi:hypothetical protein